MTFIKARWFGVANRQPHDIRLEVIHDMEADETSTTAEAIARMFQKTSVKKSAHYCYDNDSVVQCVLDKDVAYAAPGGNRDGRHYELAGFAHQSTEEWRDHFSLSMLAQVAIDVSDACDASGNQKTWLSDRELFAGRRGIIDHAGISRVYKLSDHTDPGPNFPKDLFVDMVRSAHLLSPLTPNTSGGFHVMQDGEAFLVCPLDGGYQKLQSDGGVFNSDGCNHYHGSYLEDAMAPFRVGQPNLPFVDMERVPGGDGTLYVIMRKDGAVYGPSFP